MAIIGNIVRLEKSNPLKEDSGNLVVGTRRKWTIRGFTVTTPSWHHLTSMSVSTFGMTLRQKITTFHLFMQFFLVMNLAVGGTAYFPDEASNPGGKPWNNESPTVAIEF